MARATWHTYSITIDTLQACSPARHPNERLSGSKALRINASCRQPELRQDNNPLKSVISVSPGKMGDHSQVGENTANSSAHLSDTGDTDSGSGPRERTESWIYRAEGHTSLVVANLSVSRNRL